MVIHSFSFSKCWLNMRTHCHWKVTHVFSCYWSSTFIVFLCGSILPWYSSRTHSPHLKCCLLTVATDYSRPVLPDSKQKCVHVCLTLIATTIIWVLFYQLSVDVIHSSVWPVVELQPGKTALLLVTVFFHTSQCLMEGWLDQVNLRLHSLLGFRSILHKQIT